MILIFCIVGTLFSLTNTRTAIKGDLDKGKIKFMSGYSISCLRYIRRNFHVSV